MIYSAEEMLTRYEQLVEERVKLKQKLSDLQAKSDKYKRMFKNHCDARELIARAIEIIHTQFKDEIERTVTNAIKHVFRRDIELKLVYSKRSLGIDTQILILENGEEMDPEDDLGGSIIDIISFVFRIIIWNMSSPRSRNCFLVDEPFRWTGKLIQITAIIMKELSVSHNFQVIMATHEDDLISIADKVFLVEHDGTESHISVIRE